MIKQQVIHKEEEKKKENSNNRFVNGLLLSSGCKVWHVKGQQRYLVQSQKNPNRFYDVIVNDNGIECTCEDYQRHHTGICKHVYAVLDKEIGR